MDRTEAFLDIGCANGLLMESLVAWAAEDGYGIEPYGLDLIDSLAELARQRLPRWSDRIFVGNVMDWRPPFCFDFVPSWSTRPRISGRRWSSAYSLSTSFREDA